MKKNVLNKKIVIFTVLGIVGIMLYFGGLKIAVADDITGLKDTMQGLKVSTSSNHTIVFTAPNGVGQGENFTITFPSDFALGYLDYEDFDVNAGGELTLADSASGASWGVATSSLVITITSGTGEIASSTEVTVEIGTHATTGVTGSTRITNPTSANTYTILIATSYPDNGTTTVQILTDDQVAVSAAVGQTLSFAISDNTIGFGSLDSNNSRYATGDLSGGASSSSAHTLTAGTNATSGYTVTVVGPTLTSGDDTITAIGSSAASPSTGSEQFGISITATGGSGSATAPYATADEFAYDAESTADEIASHDGSSATTYFHMVYVANIGADTEAGNYSTALTYVATANY